MKILISGGHLTPALAFVDYVKKHHPKVEMVFVGRKESSQGQESHEQRQVKLRKIKFVEFSSPKISTTKVLRSIISLPGMYVAIVKVKLILRKEKPDVFLSFGGYLAVPLAVGAKLKRIPVVTHEQTHTLGLANKLIAKLASKVAVSHAGTQARLGSNKAVLTGNPVRSGLSAKNPVRPSWVPSKLKKPILYIMGGSQGAHFINSLVDQSLEQLCRKWTVIHQVGNPRGNDNDSARMLARRDELSPSLKKSYIIHMYLEDDELAWIYRHAGLALSRSGANSVLELHHFAVPTVFIPLPHSRNQEQLKNARELEKLGGAIVLNQSEATSKSLLKTLEKAWDKRKQMNASLQKSPPKLATQASKLLFKVVKDVA